jgi:hypothetical protein
VDEDGQKRRDCGFHAGFERVTVLVTSSAVIHSQSLVDKNGIPCTAKSSVADNETSYSEYDIRFLIAQPETIGLLD